MSEVEAGDVVTRFRSEQAGFLDTSFPSIAGAGPNGAIIHYRAEAETCGEITNDCMFLLDSGGQYEDGTTDVTRTVHMGTPTDFERQCFTRVLKGNIQLDSVRFPEGTPGFVLDVLARTALWEAGLDYGHGTGHGVGAALNVHEGPISISPRFKNMNPLKEGMVVSNEPGFYKRDAFGIRIENLLSIVRVNPEHEGETPKEGAWLGFERLTHIPIQKSLIDVSLLTPKEVEWIDRYHSEVWELVSPSETLTERSRAWLREATSPLAK